MALDGPAGQVRRDGGRSSYVMCILDSVMSFVLALCHQLLHICGSILSNGYSFCFLGGNNPIAAIEWGKVYFLLCRGRNDRPLRNSFCTHLWGCNGIRLATKAIRANNFCFFCLLPSCLMGFTAIMLFETGVFMHRSPCICIEALLGISWDAFPQLRTWQHEPAVGFSQGIVVLVGVGST